MSKRHRPSSPDPPTKTTRISQTTKPFICELPPTCNKHPTTLGSGRELEAHYSTCHAHVCSAEGCNRVFPEPRFLDLHQTECHNPISDVKKDRGERIFACYDVNCKSTFATPKGRRLHLIDKHKYPPNFYFSITNKGIGGRLKKWGEGATLLRKEYAPGKQEIKPADEEDEEPTPPIDEDDESDDLVLPRSEFASGYHTPRPPTAPLPTTTVKTQTPPQRPETDIHHMDVSSLDPPHSTDVDALADSMSSLALVPPSVRFGRGGARGGFKQPQHMRGMVMRGRGRARGRGRGRGLLA